MVCPAHFRQNDTGSIEIQTVAEHSRNTAAIAAGRLRRVRLEKTGYLAGLLHDAGKMTSSFREYLEKLMAEKPAQRGSVIHSHAAPRFLLERYHTVGSFENYRDMTAELLAFATGAHHGLFDCVDETHRFGFARRLQWEDALYQEAVGAFQKQCAEPEELDALFAQAEQELLLVYEWINAHKSSEEVFFYLGLLARLLLSAVIEGDRTDTARFRHCLQPADAAGPPTPLWKKLLVRVEQKLSALSHRTAIERARQEISRRCRESADKPGGIYRLNVPTGGGKTLSSLRFALAHAAAHGKSRIVFTAPLLSILDQNAQEIRKYIGDDGLILEHHSNVVRQEPKQNTDALDPRELMAENWDAPIIITTLVQLLNTLFDGRTTCIRRFQALCNCVLVIDEVQTVPPRMLTLFNLAMNFLAGVCGATVVLCSATQPCLEKAVHPMEGALEELVPFDQTLWATFQRTRLVDAGAFALQRIPDFARSVWERSASLLVVCNTRNQARFLYEQLRQETAACFHLSAAMCQAHRKAVLKQMDEALRASRSGGQKVLCVSTQVIEAGVDISFGAVIRLTGGMDNAVQSAGRCNRNGESGGVVPVYLLSCSDENLSPLPEIRAAKTAAAQLLSDFRRNGEPFGGDLASDAAIARYYKYLYNGMSIGAQDHPLKDQHTLFDLLSVNDAYTAGWPGMERFGLHQAFRDAGAAFQVFEQDTIDVLVPYDQGVELIRELGASSPEDHWAPRKELLQKAKPYCVSLYRHQIEALEKHNGLSSYLGGAILAVAPDFYNNETGFTL